MTRKIIVAIAGAFLILASTVALWFIFTIKSDGYYAIYGAVGFPHEIKSKCQVSVRVFPIREPGFIPTCKHVVIAIDQSTQNEKWDEYNKCRDLTMTSRHRLIHIDQLKANERREFSPALAAVKGKPNVFVADWEQYYEEPQATREYAELAVKRKEHSHLNGLGYVFAEHFIIYRNAVERVSFSRFLIKELGLHHDKLLMPNTAVRINEFKHTNNRLSSLMFEDVELEEKSHPHHCPICDPRRRHWHHHRSWRQHNPNAKATRRNLRYSSTYEGRYTSQ